MTALITAPAWVLAALAGHPLAAVAVFGTIMAAVLTSCAVMLARPAPPSNWRDIEAGL